MNHVLLFDLQYGGHHGEYIEHLVSGFHARTPSTRRVQRLTVLVPPAFLEVHPTARRAIEDAQSAGCTLAPIAADEVSAFESAPSLAKQAYIEWRILSRAAQRLKPDHSIAMYLDRLLPMAAVMPSFSGQLSGIYFRPSFHYAAQGWNFDGRRSWSTRIKQRARRTREQAVLQAAAARRFVHRVWVLDPWVRARTSKVGVLPDPVAAPQGSDAHGFRKTFNIEPHRTIFLLFGQLTARKGVVETLAAIEKMSEPEARQTCLICMGAPDAATAAQLQDPHLRMRLQAKGVQLVVHPQFVDEAERERAFAAADVVLLPYRNHIGMSAVLIRAAHAQTPVIASRTGLLGALTRKHQLGLSVDAQSAPALCSAMVAFLTGAPPQYEGDRALAFAKTYSPQCFVDTLLAEL